MIKEHKYVANDISDDLIIWKYFKFEYFLWMMLYKCLYFCKADQFEDKNEFLVNEILAKLYRQNIEDLQKDIDRA
ncbi:MAG: hypothetical protein IKX51_01250, partial [Bacteroidales bacterium]|nr:hypothetical protein [Bacteroidales bacterium]